VVVVEYKLLQACQIANAGIDRAVEVVVSKISANQSSRMRNMSVESYINVHLVHTLRLHMNLYY